MSLNRKEITYSLFAGTALGAAAYGATYYVSPAIVGAANFAAANFFAPLLGATAGAIAGMGSIFLATLLIGALVSLALYAAYQWYTNKPAVPAVQEQPQVAATDAESSVEGNGEVSSIELKSPNTL